MATKKNSTTKKAKAKTTKRSTTKAAATNKKSTKKPATKKRTAAKKTTAKSVKKSASKKTTKKSLAKTKKSKISQKDQSLKKLQVFGALATAVGAALVATYGNDIYASVTSQYLAQNMLVDTQELLPAMTELFRVNLRWVIVAILGAASLYRIALLTIFANSQKTQIKQKFTSANWFELALFAPAVLATVALLGGVPDAMTLLLIAATGSGVSLLGYLTDRYNLIGHSTVQKQVIISKALLLPWVVIGISALHTYVYGFVTLSSQIFGIILAAFLLHLFVAWSHRQQITAKGRFARFEFSEMVVRASQLSLLGVLAVAAFIV